MKQPVRPTVFSSFDTCVDGCEETALMVIEPSSMKPLGLVHLRCSGRRSASIHGLYVRPGERLKGIGRSLVEASCQIAKKAGCETMGLVLAKDNKAGRQFYKKLGFVFSYEYEDGQVIVTRAL